MDRFGTNLASVHTESEMAEAQALCQLAEMDCWIGLVGLQWTDGREFAYGSSIDGEYPWNYGEPDPEARNESLCAFIDDSDHLWETASCDLQKIPLCNMPSELCVKSQWENSSNIHYQQSPCSLSIDSGITAMIEGKKWLNQIDVPIVMEFTFTIHNDTGHNASGGVIISPYNTNTTSTDNIHESYFVGLLMNTNKTSVLFAIENGESGLNHVAQSSPLNFEYVPGTYYTLKTQMTIGRDSILWYIWIDDELYLQFNTNISANISTISVGIRSVNVSLTARALFVSGDVRYSNPYISPTTTVPLVDVPLQHLVGVSVLIVYHGEGSVSNDHSVSEKRPRQLLTNITEHCIDHETNHIQSFCDSTNQYQLHVNEVQLYQSERTSYNALYLDTNITSCNGNLQSLLSSRLRTSLYQCIESTVHNTTDVDAVDMVVDIHSWTVAVSETADTTTTTAVMHITDPHWFTNATDTGAVFHPESTESVLYIFGGLALVIMCLVGTFCLLIYSKLRKIQAKSEEDITNLSAAMSGSDRFTFGEPSSTISMNRGSSKLHASKLKPVYSIGGRASLRSKEERLKPPNMKGLRLPSDHPSRDRPAEPKQSEFLPTPSDSDRDVVSEQIARVAVAGVAVNSNSPASSDPSPSLRVSGSKSSSKVYSSGDSRASGSSAFRSSGSRSQGHPVTSSQIKVLTEQMTVFTNKLDHIQLAERKIAESLQMIERRTSADPNGRDGDEAEEMNDREHEQLEQDSEVKEGFVDTADLSPHNSANSSHYSTNLKLRDDYTGRSSASMESTADPTEETLDSRDVDDHVPSPDVIDIHIEKKPSREVARHMSQWLIATEYLHQPQQPSDEPLNENEQEDGDDNEMQRKEELKQWLIDSVQLPKYYSAFVANGYDSLKFIQDIQREEELEELGIVLRGHKRRIMREIEKLRERNDEVVYDHQEIGHAQHDQVHHQMDMEMGNEEKEQEK